MMSNDCCGCGKNELNLCKLHAEKAKIDCLCATNIKGNVLNVMDEVANSICCQQLRSKIIEAECISTNDMCSQRGTINQLCVNDLTVKTINYCEQYRAVATFNSDIVYNLGSAINWDMIIDDPNNNITISPFAYTVPVSGYYVTTFHIQPENLNGTAIITGIPLGRATVFINGNEVISSSSAFLSFSISQRIALSAVILANAGDIITMNYEIFVIDPVTGTQSYVGTVDIAGNGSLINKSYFAIHYLSSLNCQPVVCQPCPIVTTPCTPIEVNCNECSERECIPLNSGMVAQCKPCNPCFPGSK